MFDRLRRQVAGLKLARHIDGLVGFAIIMALAYAAGWLLHILTT